MAGKEPTDEKLVPIFKAASFEQATILKNLLESQQISASVSNESVEKLIGFESTWANAAAVLVYESDAERARAVAVELEQRAIQAGNQQELQALADEPMLEWNKEKCLVCKQPRHAICPGCEISGTDFDPAEFEEVEISSESGEEGVSLEANADELRLMCTVCDRSFKPQYVKYCTKCGYDYGDGVDVAPVESAHDPVSDKRVAMIISAMVIACVAAAVWFFVISRNS